MNKNKTLTITSKDINKSKKIKLSPVLGYKIQTTTMRTENKDEVLTREKIEDVLREIARPLTKDEKEQ